MKYIIILFFVLASCNSSKSDYKTSSDKDKVEQSKKTVALESKSVSKAEPIRVKAMTDDTFESDTVDITIDNKYYILYPNGKIKVTDSTLNETDTFKLNTDLIIDGAYFQNYKDYLIIYYSATDYESGASFIECFDNNSFERIWKNDIYAFNLATPKVNDNVAYLASMGFVGKINLNTGKYYWRHEDLYEKTKYNSFDDITLFDDTVIFDGGYWGQSKRITGSIIINDKTGEIIKIKNTP